MESNVALQASVHVEPRSAPAAADGHATFGLVPGLVWAFHIRFDGTAESLPVERPIDVQNEGWRWLHLDLANVQTCQWLKSLDLPAAALATMLSKNPHQQLHIVGDLIHGIFADLVRNFEGASDEIGYLHFMMTDRLLISGRHHSLCCVQSVRESMERGAYRLPHVAALLELIIEHLADGIDDTAERLETDLDRIEDGLAERVTSSARQTLSSIRRTGVRVHRQISGLRALFHRLERRDTEGIRPELRIAAGKLAQRLDALDRAMLEIRERGHRLQEELSSLMAEETNRHLRILSILTAMLLPPTLVTGIFGMNVKGLPLTSVDEDFFWAIALVIASPLIAYLVIRRSGMFNS